MLTSNVWTTAGLVNGMMAEVEEVVMGEGNDNMPAVVFVTSTTFRGQFLLLLCTPAIADSCAGETPWQRNDGIYLIPIAPIKTHWTANQVHHERIQLPLAVAYACTIHKSQGLTLERAVVGLGDQEFATGLTFVAISRVKTLAGLAFVGRVRARLGALSSRKAIFRQDRDERAAIGWDGDLHGWTVEALLAM